MRYTIIIVSFFLIIISINIYDYFFKSVFEGASNATYRRQRNRCRGQLQDATETIKSLSERNIQISTYLKDRTDKSNSQKIQISKLNNKIERITNDKIDIEDQLLKCKEMNNQNVASGLT